MALRETAEILFKFATQGLSGVTDGTKTVSDFERTVEGASEAIKICEKNIGVFGTRTAVAAGTVGLFTAALAANAIAARRTADEYKKVADSLSASVRDYSLLKNALDLQGASVEAVTESMSALFNRLESGGAQSRIAENALKAFGVQAYDASGRMRPVLELTGEISEAFRKLESSAERVNFSRRLFGGTGTSSIQAFEKDLKTAIQTSRDMGTAIDDLTYRRLTALDDRFRSVGVRAKKTFDDVRMAVGEATVNANIVKGLFRSNPDTAKSII